MTKTTETWEERFDQAFLDVMYKDDGYTEERAVLKAFIRAELALARQEEAAAYGGCTNCYGKGYSTTKMYASGRHYTQEQNPYIPCKECDRGTQFAKAQERARQEGERTGREETIEEVTSILRTSLKTSNSALDTVYLPGHIAVPKGNDPEDSYYNLALIEAEEKIKALTNPT